MCEDFPYSLLLLYQGKELVGHEYNDYHMHVTWSKTPTSFRLVWKYIAVYEINHKLASNDRICLLSMHLLVWKKNTENSRT